MAYGCIAVLVWGLALASLARYAEGVAGSVAARVMKAARLLSLASLAWWLLRCL